MRLATSLFFAMPFLATVAMSAEPAIPSGHSVVNVVFITSLPNSNQPMGMLTQGPKARVGDMVMPIKEVRPISVTIDKEFVGHAMVGYASITPTFVLESGRHEFSFSCEGFKPVSQKITVVGTGSKQYLLVRMQPLPSPNQVSDAGGPASEPAVSGGHAIKR